MSLGRGCYDAGVGVPTRLWRSGLAWIGAALCLSPLGAGARGTVGAPPGASVTAPPASQVPVSRPRRAERPVPFNVGETLEYDVSWSSLLTAGTATLKVEDKRPSFGSTAYYVYAEGRPTPLIARFYPVYYKLDTLLDVYTLLPQRAASYSDEHGQKKLNVVRFNRGAGTADYEVQSSTPTKNRLLVPPLTEDALSAVMAVRATPLLEGGRITMPVVERGVLYTMKVTVGAKELVATGAGRFTAWRLKPTVVDAEGRELARGIALWISDDARRLPVRLEAELAVGRFVLLLKSVTP